MDLDWISVLDGRLIFHHHYKPDGGFMASEEGGRPAPRIGKMIDLRLYEELKRQAVERRNRRIDKGKGED